MDDMVYIAWYSIVIIENACVLLCEICVKFVLELEKGISYTIYFITIRYNTTGVQSALHSHAKSQNASHLNQAIESNPAQLVP